ncbi:toll/interleukin-1 receptor domain-containing protein [Mariprofundus ferrooxydans]|uniref:toll/interleukin-1 receptor domain-containing protein n=1 Tax=Mariprofundus ferrooxydans TaxID=314344 RepID=UPI00142F91E9|nr:toll/interleukin-1 receptor domain-containing protein [Mariprofundus ferrooxydans]
MSEPKNPPQIIFLSHATPEDDEFTRWLAGKLACAGYMVWCDLDELNGGDYFWNKIENVIRNESARMIAIVSNASYTKDGVRNEWDLGITIEKTIPGFVIPVRIDNFDFGKLPITIHRKNVIDFNKGWHFGLAQLLDTLEEAGISKNKEALLPSAKAWLPSAPEGSIEWVERKETLESNWLQITSLPSIQSTKIIGDQRQIDTTDKTRSIPWFEYGDQIVGFAPRDDIVEMFKGELSLSPLSSTDTDFFISDGAPWSPNHISPFDARNRVSMLIRQAWDIHMEHLGLKPYELSNRRLIWYVPFELIPKDKVEFVDANGKRRKKQLLGTSAKYGVNWHYAVSARPVLGGIRRLELGAHIIFTDTEGNPLESNARMHQLRRRFCKSWWNDRWRGFLRAFLSFISQGEKTIALPVGGDKFIQINALPISFLSPKGLSDSIEVEEDELVLLEDSDIDDVDDDMQVDDSREDSE